VTTTRDVLVRLNGRRTVWNIPDGVTLLQALREHSGMNGAKEGCGIGECGSCMVIMDGTPVVSCLVLAVEAEGASVTTIEGTSDRRITRMREAFLAEGAFQCGACTPGMIVAASRIPDGASPGEIREGLSGNICRCTGYASIVRAVQRAHRKSMGDAQR
jgi:carbon-monoxide dehydrogenase small subunit